MLHGVFFDHKSWIHQLSAFGRVRTVHAPDLPGHGVLRDQPFTLGAARDRVLRSLDESREERVIVVGWSLGGLVALEIAATVPDRVAALVLTGATLEPTSFLAGPLRSLIGAAAYAPRWLSTTAVLGLVRLTSNPSSAHVLRRANPTVPEGLRALASLPNDGFRERLAKYCGPTLILNGRNDFLARPCEDEFVSAALEAKLQRIDGAGHLAPVEAPAAFNDSVLAFARRVDVDAARALMPGVSS